MLSQIPVDPVGIILLIVAVVVLFVFNFLAVRWVESKTLASKKKAACFFVALLGVLAFLVILWIWQTIAGAMSGWASIDGTPWPNPQYLLVLGPMIVFLVYIILVQWLIDATWKNSVLISLVALLLLSLFLTFVPFVGEFLEYGIY